MLRPVRLEAAETNRETGSGQVPLQQENHLSAALRLDGVDDRPGQRVKIRFAHVFNHDIGVNALGFNMPFMHRLDDGVELQRHGCRRAGAFTDIAGHAAREAGLFAGLDKHCQIQRAGNIGTGQQVQALDQDDRCRLALHGLRAPPVRLEIIKRCIDRLAGFQAPQMRREKAVILCRRFVEIERVGVEIRDRRRVDIIVVLGDDIGPVRREMTRQRLGEPRLAGGRTSDNTKQEDRIRHAPRPSPFSSVSTPGSSGMRGGASANRALREAALLYLELGAALGDPARVFRAAQVANISELARGQQFARFGADDDAAAMRDELLDLARMTGELRTRYRAALESEDEVLAASLTAQVETAERAEREVAQLLTETYPDFVRRFRPTPVDLDSLQARLRPDDLLVVPVEGDRGSWIIRVDAEGASWNALDNPQLAANVDAVRDGVERPGPGAFPLDATHRLFRQIFPQGTQGARRVLLYGGQRLASVPLGLLTSAEHEGGLSDAPWLIREAAVQVVGNLALLGEAAAPSAMGSNVRFAGIGGVELPGQPGTEGTTGIAALFRGGRPDAPSIASLPPLPGAARELREIADALRSRDNVLLIGPDAAEENVKRTDLSAIDILVFATHGLVAGEVTGLWEPALLVGTQGPDSGEDGLLGASEIARLDLDADWVILSACNTAAGSGSDGPTYSGLATAFAQAGARSLLLSHWRVRDDAAAFLSVGTVAGSRTGADRAEALRQAQLDLISQTGIEGASHPSVWAPFVLVDN